MPDREAETRRLAAEAVRAGDATGWFERLYVAAGSGEALVPWDRGAPHPLIAEWVQTRRPDGGGRRAVVVGAGLGEDAELVASLGFETVAFDISPTAIRTARERHPGTAVRYVVADLLDPPADWRRRFDLVVESLTVQSLPDPLRPRAIEAVRDLVAPGGTLLVVAAVRDAADGPVQGPPWPLTREEIDAFAAGELQPVQVEDLPAPGDPSSRRWRAEFREPPPSSQR
jgi:SAM-dependent methyltransferase